MCVYIYIYIYIERERERKRDWIKGIRQIFLKLFSTNFDLTLSGEKFSQRKVFYKVFKRVDKSQKKWWKMNW